MKTLQVLGQRRLTKMQMKHFGDLNIGIKHQTDFLAGIEQFRVGNFRDHNDVDPLQGDIQPNIDQDPLEDLNEFPYVKQVTKDVNTSSEYIQDQQTAQQPAPKNLYVIRPIDFNPMEMLSIVDRYRKGDFDDNFAILRDEEAMPDAHSAKRKELDKQLKFAQKIGIKVFWTIDEVIANQNR